MTTSQDDFVMRFNASLPGEDGAFEKCLKYFNTVADKLLRLKRERDEAHARAERDLGANPVVPEHTRQAHARTISKILDFDNLGIVVEQELKLLVQYLGDHAALAEIGKGQDKPMRKVLKAAQERGQAALVDDVAEALAKGFPARKKQFDKFSADLQLDAEHARARHHLAHGGLGRLDLGL